VTTIWLSLVADPERRVESAVRDMADESTDCATRALDVAIVARVSRRADHPTRAKRRTAAAIISPVGRVMGMGKFK
jgi:hypothetical protein